MPKEIKQLKYLFFFLSFGALLFVSIALFSLFFRDKASLIKAQERQLHYQNQLLAKEIAQKERYFQSLQENIEQMEELVGLRRHTKKRKSRLSKLTPTIRHLLLQTLPRGYPSKSRRITSYFGYRNHPIYHVRKFHHGIDFGGREGTPIKATADGVVEFAGFSKGGYGNLVILRHNFGFQTLYGHMLKNLKVSKGDFVKKGEVIGYLGNSGISTGPHLHYEIKYLQNILDPLAFLTLTSNSLATLIQNEQRIYWQGVVQALTTLYQKNTQLFLAQK